MVMTIHKVGIVLVNFHGVKDTLECLDSLFELKTSHELKVYVVNVQDEKEGNQLKGHKSKPHVIELNENLGFSGANNMGMNKAISEGAQILVLLNNDTTLDEGFLDPLVNQALKKDVGLVSPKIYFYPGNEFHKDSYKKDEQGKVIWYAGGIIDWQNVYAYHRGVDEVDHGQFDEQEETQFATGCCVALASRTYKTIGKMSEEYFFSWEDTDWSVRAKSKGLKIVYEPISVIWHKNAGSSGGSGSKFHQYYHNRNRMLFGYKYAPIRTKLALVKEGLLRIFKGNNIEKRAVMDMWLGRLGRSYE